jgi:hypothetical protein
MAALIVTEEVLKKWIGSSPNMTTVQRDAIVNPSPGQTVFNSTTNALEFWDGNVWQAIGGLGGLPPGAVVYTAGGHSFEHNTPQGFEVITHASFDAIGVGAGVGAPTQPLDVNGSTIRIRTPFTPANAAAAGTPGTIAWDAGFVYVCVAGNSWKRAAIAVW